MPEDTLARLEASDEIHGLRRGDPGLWNACALFPAELVRLVNEHVCAHGDVLGVCSSIGQTENCISFLESAFAFAGELLNNAAELDTKGLWRLRWNRVHAFSLQKVHAVEAECLDANECLSVCWLGAWNVGMKHGRGRALASLDIYIQLISCVAAISVSNTDVPTARMVAMVLDCVYALFFQKFEVRGLFLESV